jgi:hypothetical protein
MPPVRGHFLCRCREQHDGLHVSDWIATIAFKISFPRKEFKGGIENEQYNLSRRVGRGGVVYLGHVGASVMTIPSMTPASSSFTASADESEIRSGSYVDWACALCGATLAAALSLVLFTFGSGVGLSLVSPWPSERINGTLFSIIMVLWAVFVPLISFALGGYVAGRMRRPWQSLATDEVAFRDGAHGGLVWGASIVIGAIALPLVAGSAANMAGSALSSTATLAAQPAVTRTVDELFRSDSPVDETSRATREEVQRIIGTTGTTTLAQPDQDYVAGLVARSTGLAPAEATQRVNEVLTQTRAAAETARKVGVVAAFFAAVTMLMGLAVAWFAARKGGEHRDTISKRMQR